jgi:hypothetical protein
MLSATLSLYATTVPPATNQSKNRPYNRRFILITLHLQLINQPPLEQIKTDQRQMQCTFLLFYTLGAFIFEGPRKRPHTPKQIPSEQPHIRLIAQGKAN